jgi:hypothetical protein
MVKIQLFIILLILIIFLYIVYRMIQKHVAKYSLFEGFSTAAVIKLDKQNQTSPAITDITDNMYNIPLNQVCIKASYNSAFDGKEISTDMLEYVMSRGCRFLDFELYLDGGSVVVNYSTDPTFSTFENTNSDPVSFNTIMDTITKYTAPNPNDPLFIHLRVKSDSPNIYGEIVNVLKPYTSVYTDQINGNTNLIDLKQKIIIAMDRSIRPNDKIGDLASYVSVFTGGSTWSIDRYSEFKNQKTSPPKPNDDFKTTNVTQLKLALPDLEKSSTNPATPHDFITNYGVQTIACRFYKNDIFNDLCEDIFAEHQSAFVPLGYVLNYIKRQKEDPRPRKLKYGPNIIHE